MTVRNKRNRGLPPNLHLRTDGRFIYVRPSDRKQIPFGRNKAQAVRAAIKANDALHPQDQLIEHELVMAATGATRHNTLAELIERYLNERLPELKPSPSYDAEVRRMLGAWSDKAGQLPLREVSIATVATVLDQYGANASNKMRARLSQVFRFGMAKGLVDVNPVEKTLPKVEETQVERLSLGAYLKIRDAAIDQGLPWVANAMELGLHTLHRRGDICRMRFDQIDRGYLFVAQSKVERHGYGKLATRITPALQRIIERCRDDIASPYLVHRMPQRRVVAKGRDHWSQISPNLLSHAFQDIRDELGLYGDLLPLQRPGFGQIRALGAHLYERSGIDPGPLMGHASSSMTRVYLERHEARFAVVEGELDVELLREVSA